MDSDGMARVGDALEKKQQRGKPHTALLFSANLIAPVGFGAVERFVGAIEGALGIFTITM